MANLQVGVAGNGTVTVGAGASVHSPASNTLTLGTNGDERLRITSAGKVGINQATPEALLHIEAGSSGASYTANAADTLILERDGACLVDIRTTSAVEGGIVFSDNGARAIGRMLYNHNENSMNFTTNSIERLVIRVDGNVSIASSLAVAGVSTAAAFLPSVGQLANKNLVINGAMKVAQRGTTSSTQGTFVCDRFESTGSGHDEVPTHSQHALSSSDTGPWADGFRYSWHIQNGNQTGGAGTGDYWQPQYKFEAQDIRNAGWDYTSASSYITLSYWIKVSVAGDYTFNLTTEDGTGQRYPMSTGSLSANTWTKITKTIPGNSNITITNDNGSGLTIMWYPYLGSNYTSGATANAWAASAGNNYGTTNTTSWWTTNDSTWEITGVQVEVGSVATPFEFLKYGQELALCQRYYQEFPRGAADNYGPIGTGRIRNATNAHIIVYFPEMRTSPTVTKSGDLRILHAATSTAVNSVASSHMTRNIIFLEGIVASGLTQGEGCMMTANNDADGKITLSAEL